MLRLKTLAFTFLIAATLSTVANAELVIHDFDAGASAGVGADFNLSITQSTLINFGNTGEVVTNPNSYRYLVPRQMGSSVPPPGSPYFVTFTYNIKNGNSLGDLNQFPDEFFIPVFATDTVWDYQLTIGTTVFNGDIGTAPIQIDGTTVDKTATSMALRLIYSDITNSQSSVTYGGSGNSFTLTAVPEPTSALMFGAAVFGLVARRRRKTA